MQKKQFYEAPEAEVLPVRFESNFCETTGNGIGTGEEVNPFGSPNPMSNSRDYRTY